jgi:pyridoxine kinase
MPLALIASSFVAGSRVGGFPQALALAAFEIDPVLAPTVLFGRRPGEGAPPGGGPVDPLTFSGMLEGVEGLGLFGLADVVITGYFASPEQVETAAALIDAVRVAPRTGAFNQEPLVLVDPIMGDEPGGRYVSEAVASAVVEQLAPRADVLTPNLWELRRLTGAAARDVPEVVEAARGLGRPTLVTSAPVGEGRIGAVFVDAFGARLFSHRFVEGAPHGTGDLVAAVLAAGLVQGRPPAAAAERAVRAAAEAVFAAEQWRAPELPIVALGGRLREPTAEVEVRRL